MSQPPSPAYSIEYASQTASHDADHLKVLSICWYVWSGLTAFFACIPFIHVGIGIAMLSGAIPPGRGGAGEEKILGLVFVLIGSAIIVLGWALALLGFLTGRSLARRRWRTFCLVIAGCACINVPIGTTLGVFTFIVLLRPSVGLLFGRPVSS